jgi:hypothetical protein
VLLVRRKIIGFRYPSPRISELADQLEGLPNRECHHEIRSRVRRFIPYATAVASSIGSMIDGSSFSGLLTRVEIGHIRMGADGNGRINS